MFAKLFRILVKENFSLKRFLGFDPKSNRLKTVLIILAIVYALVVVLGGFIYLTYDLAKNLESLGAIHLLINFIFFYAVSLVALVVLFRMNGLVFYSKDYEMLAHYPIHYRALFISKFLIMMMMVYASVLLLTLPMIGYYIYFAALNFFQLVMFIIGVLLFPIIPLIVFSFLALGFATLTKGFKRSQLMNTILMIVVFLGFSVLLMNFTQVELGNPLLGQQLFMQAIERVYPLLRWFSRSIIETNGWLFLVYVLVNLTAISVYIYYVPVLAHITNQSTKKTAKRLSSTLVMKERSIMHSMIVKEWKKMINSPIYALNAGLGPLLLILLPTASIFFKTDILSMFEMIPEGEDFIELSILSLFGFSIAMSYSPSISLSIEGKHFWILKASPVSPLKIMVSKAMFNVLLILFPGIFGLILFAFVFEFGIGFTLTSLVLTVVFALFTSLFGSLINLYLPKFDFINEVEVIKQSAAALVAVFSGFAFIVLAGFLLVWLNNYMMIELSLLIVSLIFIVLTTSLSIFLKKKVDAVFLKYTI
jgi:ABC-2 type transport system permease protein